MMRCWLSRTCAGLAFALAFGTCAQAESSLDVIRTRGLIRIGVKTDTPPFGSLDQHGRPVGFEIDLARFLARVLFDDDGRAQLVPVTTTTRFAALQSGLADLLIATITATEERRSQAELSESYFRSGSLMLVAEGSPLARFADTAGHRIAVVKGSVQARDVAELQPHALVISVDSLAEGARAVKMRQVDALVYDDVVLLTLAQQDPAFRAAGSPIRPRPYVVVARKGDTELIRWVNGWLARMRRDGSYGVMWRKYFGPFESHLVGD